MAKARPRVYSSPTPLTGAQLEAVRQRLRDGFPGYRDPFPQDEVKFKADYKAKWLPPIGGTRGLSPAGRFVLECNLDGDRLTADALAGIFRNINSFQPVGDACPGMNIECELRWPPRRDHPPRNPGVDFSVSIGPDFRRFHCSAGNFSWCRDDGSPFKDKQVEARIMGNMCREQEEIFGLVIRAGRLPLEIVRSGPSFTVRHTQGGGRPYLFEPEVYGIPYFYCDLPGWTPDDLARRFFDVLAALPSTGPPRFAGSVGVSRNKGKPDPTPSAYALIQSHPWPSTSCRLETGLHLEGPEALDGLGPILASPTASVRVELGQVRPEGQKARNPAAKLMVKARRKDHLLSLSVPPELSAMKPQIERVAGLAFEG